jgi:hypothetical protein
MANPASSWTPIQRGETPAVEKSRSRDHITIRVKTYPSEPLEWRTHFERKVEELCVSAGYESTGGIYCTAEPAELESAVAAIDTAIEYANKQFEANDLPEIEAKWRAEAEVRAAAASEMDDLKRRAESLARPEPPPREW